MRHKAHAIHSGRLPSCICKIAGLCPSVQNVARGTCTSVTTKLAVASNVAPVVRCFWAAKASVVTWDTIKRQKEVNPCIYLVRSQNLPRILDKDTLVNDAQTTQRLWIGHHLHGGLFPWHSCGLRELQRHLTHTAMNKCAYADTQCTM